MLSIPPVLYFLKNLCSVWKIIFFFEKYIEKYKIMSSSIQKKEI